MSEQTAPSADDSARVTKKRVAGFIGMAIGFFAFSVAFLSPWIQASIDPPPQPIEVTAADLASRLAEATKAKFTGEDYVAPAMSAPKPSRFMAPVVIGSGMLAIGLGLFSLLRAEPRMVGGAAIALGLSAAIVQWSIIIAAAVIFLLIVMAILGALGIDL